MGLAVPAGSPLCGLLGLNDVSLGAGCGLVARIVIRLIPQRQITIRRSTLRETAQPLHERSFLSRSRHDHDLWL